MKKQTMLNILSYFRYVVLIIFILGLTYAQDDRTIQFRSGDLLIFVDRYRGNFSIFDSQENNLDFVSWLFGGPSAPSSYFHLSVDRHTETLDQMEPLYPLGTTLNSQVDGVFLAGKQRDIHLEVAYFALDVGIEEQGQNTFGMVLHVSNISPNQSRRVGARIMIDPDIGELRNDPLIYLPSGAKITRSTIFNSNNIPRFLFVGQKNIAETRPIGQGFYIYPFLEATPPSSMVVANWRKITEQKNEISKIDSSLSYQESGSKDVGIALCFGPLVLGSNEGKYIGFVVSEQFSRLTNMIEESALTDGVFSDTRFEIEEILQGLTNIPNQHSELPSLRNNNFDNQRQMYRQQRLGVGLDGIDHNRQKSLQDLYQRSLTNIPNKDDVWKTIYRFNLEMHNKSQYIDQKLTKDQDAIANTNNESPQFFNNKSN